MKKEGVLIFDIGKTNKKALIFDRQLNILHEEEIRFEEIPDEDGFPGDDMEKMEAWMLSTCKSFVEENTYILRGINFTSYGASLMYLNDQGESLTPLYNYLKPMPEGIVEPLYRAYGGETEFCRSTGSPSLGMLNSGFQARWLQTKKPKIFQEVKTMLHFPQYLSQLLTGEKVSEHTSIGCHTGLWDFDNMTYHPWTRQLGQILPDPVSVETTFPSRGIGKGIPVGVGIHDSSSSLVPYFMKSKEEFILLSTGTWCITMNPFNEEPLTAEQLKKDCLAFLSIQKKPVKSSRLFMGRIHDVNVKYLSDLFAVRDSAYKQVRPDKEMIRSLRQKDRGKRMFFRTGIPDDYLDRSVGRENFTSFEEAYHRFMMDLAELIKESVLLVISKEDNTKNLYISGGFSKNPIFLLLMASIFSRKRVYTSEIANASALGAAMVLWKGIDPAFNTEFDLGLKYIAGDPSLMD